MIEKYNPQKIEPKWQEVWEKTAINKAEDFSRKPKFYCLDMFPYPSGEGMHMGHVENYTGSDIYARYLRMKGYNVLHASGFDAFGLPAENYAIKHGIYPSVSTKENIDKIRKQEKAMGFSYCWDREITTSDPTYYRWTQWIFLQLYKRGLAYEAEAPINWCPSCKTGLANEEVVDGLCERCGATVSKKKLKQWILKITDYADRLLKDLKNLDWPEHIKLMQENWIGRSEGTEVIFKAKLQNGKQCDLPVFTTRPDTLFGATYMVLAPEHPAVEKLTDKKLKAKVKKYITQTVNETDTERTSLEKEKTGLFIGAMAKNPVNGQKIPIWISDYVLLYYGTGAIMAVPAHDTRDFEFAKKFNLPIMEVISPTGKPSGQLSESYIEEGKLINSQQFNGLSSKQAKNQITSSLAQKKLAKKAVCYKLRDWIFSRQRYWGEPIPIIHCKKCGTVPVPEEDLPVELPKVKNYQPTGTGESPLAAIKDWVNIKCPLCSGPAKRETNTMPQWAGSCWYFLRFADPKNNQKIFDKRKIKYWLPVDLYIGGAEHAVLHLLYARFWNKVLYDEGLLSFKEPFLKLVNQGLILGPDGVKMSKSRGNIINPDSLVQKYGADTLRLYVMFLGPFEDNKAWNSKGIEGIVRFLKKVWYLSRAVITSEVKFSKPEEFPNPLREVVETEIKRITHKTIKKVSEDMADFRFNTAISALMEYINYLIEAKQKVKVEEAPEMWREACEILLILLCPFAPHLTEELWQGLGFTESIFTEKWPSFDPKLIKEDTITLVVQINGKVRDELIMPAGTDKNKASEMAQESDKVIKYLENKKIKKIIYIKDKLINIVVEE
jgi:leucyl-tRNA synthetase